MHSLAVDMPVVRKRPSSQSHNVTMKRPATGSKETMRNMIEGFAAEHAEEEGQNAGGDDDKRDKGKAEKFMKLYTIPAVGMGPKRGRQV